MRLTMRKTRLPAFGLILGLMILSTAQRKVTASRSKQNNAILFPGMSFGNHASIPAVRTKTHLKLPHNLDLGSMDRTSLSLINSIDNITSFVDLFGLPLPDDIAVRFGGETQTATMAACKPEMKTVALDLPVEANTLFYPTCVRLEQCGGCCYGPLLTCLPKTSTAVKLKVLKTVLGDSGSSDRSNRRRSRREALPTYHEVEVMKHEECECGCKVQEKHCNPDIHDYLQGECSCVCKNKQDKAKCEQQNDMKYWDNESCSCYCRWPFLCGTGEKFSPVTCRCE